MVRADGSLVGISLKVGSFSEKIYAVREQEILGLRKNK